MLDDLYTMLARREGADRHGRRHAKRRPPKGQRPNFPFLAVLLGLLAAGPAAAGHPSPADWRDQVIYQIFTDRFANGDPFNDNVEGNFDPASGTGVHGGDFDGIRGKLDYLDHLGVGAIWISPVVLNAYGEYHGYAARDFFAIAPHMGTLAELQQLVAECHARGIYVVIDVVVNHMGDLIDSGTAGYPTYNAAGTYALRWRNPARKPAPPFDDLSWYHAHGHIGSYSDPEQILGELSGLDDLKTENAAVRAKMIEAGEWLIAQTDCDGFRVDTVKHTELGLWQTWTPAVRAFAAGQGKADFLQFGEAFDGNDAKVGSYTGTVGGGAYKFDSMLYYPMFYTTTGVFAFDDAPSAISGRFTQLTQYDATVRERLVSFLDNHDQPRFLSFGVADQDASRLEAALGWQLSARGIPCVYYGTEQEFDGGNDPFDREDMWDGQWDFGPSDGDNFDLAQPMFLFTRDLIAARTRHAALRRGVTADLFVESTGPGLYVTRRILAGVDTAVVAVNTAEEPRTRVVSGPWLAGTPLVDTLDPEATAIVVGSGDWTVDLPARGVRIYVSAAAAASARAVPGADPLQVRAVAPGHDQRTADLHRPLTLVFDRPVDPATLAAAFTLSPPMPGQWQARGDTARYLPEATWAPGTRYDWSLAAGPGGLRGADGAELDARYDAFFTTTAAATGVSVPGGYTVERIARQGLTQPEGVIPAGGRAPFGMIVADASRDRLFTLTPGGDLGHWLGDARWSRPEGLAPHPTDRRLAVLAPEGLFVVDALRRTALAASSATVPGGGGVAWGDVAYGSKIFFGDRTGNRIRRFDDPGVSTLASGINGPEALAFAPGGAWGTALYVADANLAALGGGNSASDGAGRILTVDPAGTVTTFVSSPALLGGVSALAFDTGGAFGGDLFAADVLGERVLRITPGGSISVFATGFANLDGSSCLAFGPDGALVVSDRGTGNGQVIRIAAAAFVTGADDAPAGAGGPRAALAFAPPTPNPARDGVRFGFDLVSDADDVRLEVFDVRGRAVRALAAGPRAAGRHVVAWDGRGEGGTRLAAGLYFARLRAGGDEAVQRVVLTP